jgi:hypothetical protein
LFTHPALWDGIHFLGWDAIVQSWPDLIWGYKSLAAGELPFWNPYEKGGFNVLGDPECGVLYPINWLFYGVAALFGSGFGLILVKNMFHIALGATGMYFYLKRMELSAPAYWMGSISYMLSGRLARGMDQTPIYTVAWFPWMLIALDEVMKRPGRKSGLILGLVSGLAFLSGYSPNFFRNAMAIIPVAVVTLYGILKSKEKAFYRLYLWSLGKALSLASLIWIGLSLPTILAIFEIFPHSERSQIKVSDTLTASFSPEYILHAISPHILGSSVLYFYIGVLPFLLAIIAVVHRYQRERILWGILATIYFLLACGSNTFLLPTILQLAPFFKFFRIPDQYLYISIFFLCILAAQGLNDLLKLSTARQLFSKQVSYVVLAQAFAIVFIGFLAAKLKTPPDSHQLYVATMSIIFVSLAGFCLIALLNAPLHRRAVIGWLAIALLFLDLATQLKLEYNVVQPKPNLVRDAQLAKLPGLHEQSVRLADGNDYFGYRVGIRKNIREFFGRHYALVIQRFWKFREAAATNYNLMASANVRYYANPPQEVTNQAGSRARTVIPGIMELLDHAPFAYWVGKPLLVQAEHEVINKLKEQKPGTAAVIEAQDLSSSQQARLTNMTSLVDPAPAALKKFKRNYLRFTINAPNEGVVVINENYYPGWRATIDGIPTEIFRTNYTFRGIFVKPGHHLVEMRYRPTKLIIGLIIYAITVCSLLFLGGMSLISKNRVWISSKAT